MKKELFVKDSKTGRSKIKSEFLKLVKYECKICKNSGLHNNERLNLELDHINGDRYDNRLSNLRLLCPNCHSQQKTSCRTNGKNKSSNSRKIKEAEVILLAEKGENIRSILNYFNASDSGSNYDVVKGILERNNVNIKIKLNIGRKYQDDSWRRNPRPHTEKINWPNDQELAEMVFKKPMTLLSKDLKVSDVAINRRCKKRNIKLPERGYWLKKGD